MPDLVYDLVPDSCRRFVCLKTQLMDLLLEAPLQVKLILLLYLSLLLAELGHESLRLDRLLLLNRLLLLPVLHLDATSRLLGVCLLDVVQVVLILLKLFVQQTVVSCIILQIVRLVLFSLPRI